MEGKALHLSAYLELC